MNENSLLNEKSHGLETGLEIREKEHNNSAVSREDQSNSPTHEGSTSTRNDSPEIPPTGQNSNLFSNGHSAAKCNDPSVSKDAQSVSHPPEGDTEEYHDAPSHSSSNVDNGEKENGQSDENLNPDAAGGTSFQKDYEPSLKIVETDDCLKFKWNEVPDATKYTIEIMRPSMNEPITKTAEKSEYELKNNIYNFKRGETIILTIKFFDASGQDSIIVKKCHVVAGGDDVISGLQVKLNETAPHSVIDLTWTKPKNDPEKYKITFIELDANEDGIPSYAEDIQHTAVDLQPSAKYKFTVAAVFSDGHEGLPVSSEIINTDIPPPELFKAEKVQAEKDRENPYRQITVTWMKPNVKVKIKHYEVFLKSADGKKTEQQVIKPADKKAHFKDLRSNTSYRAYVTTVDKFLHESKESVSEEVMTDLAPRIEGFDIKESGKPIIEKCIADEKPNGLMSRFEWKLPNLGIERYNYKPMEIVAVAKLRGKEEKILQVEKRTEAVPIPLQRGKLYEFHLSCSYIDLDNPTDKLQAVKKQDLVTDVGKPSILNVKWEKKENKS
uniref:uncharacterized protein LOC120337886 n=1 Tax=Styela clava TaxID=7725 RepID=UPI00193AA115|nr:uncharacterized protein LOC120337886 [Styela clava]